MLESLASAATGRERRTENLATAAGDRQQRPNLPVRRRPVPPVPMPRAQPVPQSQPALFDGLPVAFQAAPSKFSYPAYGELSYKVKRDELKLLLTKK